MSKDPRETLARIRAREQGADEPVSDEEIFKFDMPFISHRPGCDQRHDKRTACNRNRPEEIIPSDVERLVAFAEAVLDLADEWRDWHAGDLRGLARKHLGGDRG